MKDLTPLVFMLVILAIFCLGPLYALDIITCHSKYADFETKYGFLSGCQIKPDDKWIPAESYYFKEE